jgi:hypothetical protein
LSGCYGYRQLARRVSDPRGPNALRAGRHVDDRISAVGTGSSAELSADDCDGDIRDRGAGDSIGDGAGDSSAACLCCRGTPSAGETRHDRQAGNGSHPIHSKISFNR